jgi:hypothetical protein
VDVDAPAVTEKPLQGRGAENQQGVAQQRSVGGVPIKRRIEAAFDQPGERNAREVGGDQRYNAKKQKPAVALDEKFDAVVMTENLFVLLLGLAAQVLALHVNRGSSHIKTQDFSRQDAKLGLWFSLCAFASRQEIFRVF